ncbi:MAG: hypothetical protein ACR2MO_00655 [Acidimicrobiales bacterium]
MPGGHWTAVTLEASGAGLQVCIDSQVSGRSANHCVPVGSDGSKIGPLQLVSLGVSSGGDFLVAAVAKDVTGVRFTQADGSAATLPPADASMDLAFNVIVVHLGSNAAPDALVALDVDGREIGRRSPPTEPTPPVAPPPFPPMPADVRPPPPPLPVP